MTINKGNKSTVYLICGFIGAGTSTFAKKLEEKTGAVRITKDEWSIRLIGNDPTIDGYADWDRKIIDLSRDFAFYLAEKGIDVILDEGFWEKEQREEMKLRINAIGAKCVTYYVECPIDVARKRTVGRNDNLTGNSFRISNEMFDGYLKYWEPPTKDENYIIARDMNPWYGWLIEQSLDDQSIFEQYMTVTMKSEDDDWKEHVIEVPEGNVGEVVNWLAEHLKPTWYAHLVKGNELIVVYKNKNFRVKQGESFKEVREYGKGLGIIEEQLPSDKLFKLARDSGY